MTNMSMKSRNKVMFAVGGICATTIYRVDEVLLPPAKLLADQMQYVVDGMALSAAFGFQRLGGEAIICGRIGDDPEGIAMRKSLMAEGIDVSTLHTVEGSISSRVGVIVNRDGDRVVVVYHDEMSDRSAGWLPLDRIGEADIVHCDLRWPEGARAALDAARSLHVPSMVDGDVAPRDVMHDLVPLADYAVFSDAGILRYAGCDDIETALRLVGAQHRGHVGASCGSLGYYWYESGRIRHVPAPRVEVVDTLSAGDIFHGAFAMALLEGKTIAQAAEFACIAASLKCTRFGGRLGSPSRHEVETFALMGSTSAVSIKQNQ